MKILIAEDNKISRFTLMSFLKDEQYKLIECANGEEAFRKWEEENPDVLITDIQMPGMSGIELISKIRSQPSNKYTFIIVITSHNDEKTFQESFEVGADDFILKPFTPIELKNRLLAGKRIVALQEKQLVLFALGQMIELRDAETGSHTERVGIYSKILAFELKRLGFYPRLLTRAFIDNLELSSTLHDIGKVGVSDEILRKPGKYTTDEFEKMKEHTVIGHDMLENIRVRYPNTAFLEIASDVAYCHHEKFDGSGYPRGLKGEEIPLAARIVTLADIYDALRSKRVYKTEMAHEETKQYIIDKSGVIFDPKLVTAFINIEQQFKKIYETMK